MTTILSLASRDFIVVGCDSLATSSEMLANPYELMDNFFDSSGKLKLDPDGQPTLRTPQQLFEKSRSRPVNQLPSVVKLYDLGVPSSKKGATPSPKACLLFAGAACIGNISIRNLVEGFKADARFNALRASYTMKTLAERFKEFILEVFEQQIPEKHNRPLMEVMLSGYSSAHREPEVWKMFFYWDNPNKTFVANVFEMVKKGDYNLNFGGQYDVIERVVKGIDWDSSEALKSTAQSLLDKAFYEIEDGLRKSGFTGAMTKPDFTASKYDLFAQNGAGVRQLFYDTDVATLSEQAGIDLVYFLIDVMIKAQQFSTSIPTVGGDIHIARLTKNDGFRWVSPETYKFQDQHIPKF